MDLSAMDCVATIIVGGSFNTARAVDWVAIGL